MKKQKTIVILVAALFIVSIVVLVINLKNVLAPKPPEKVVFEDYSKQLPSDIDDEIDALLKDDRYLNEINSSIEETEETDEQKSINDKSPQSPQSALPSGNSIFDIQGISDESQLLQSDNEFNNFFNDDALLKEIDL